MDPITAERIATHFPAGPFDREQHRGARRAFRRYPLHADVKVECATHTVVAIAINVSGGGMRLVLDQPLGDGEHVVLRFSTRSTGIVVANARVVWCRPMEDGALAGLQFVIDAPFGSDWTQPGAVHEHEDPLPS